MGERLDVNGTLLSGLGRRRLLVGEPAGADHGLLEHLHRLGHRADLVAAPLIRDLDVDRTAGERRHGACQPDGRTRNRACDQQRGGDRDRGAGRDKGEEGEPHMRQRRGQAGGRDVASLLRLTRRLRQSTSKLREALLRVTHHHHAVGGIEHGRISMTWRAALS